MSSLIGSPQVYSEGKNEWNEDWSYKERLFLPIQTGSPEAVYQPIDIRINFSHPCWAKNPLEHSIRVCCWDGREWYELESQIYDLQFSDENHISSCSLVFLIPPISNGEYYVYYDDSEKPAPNYVDHVSIRDCHYYFEPISGLSVEGDYYEIIDDGEIVYGVGEKGQVLNRRLSQVAIVMKPGTKKFDIRNSDLLASFSFAFHRGTEEKDEVSSDQQLLSKEVLVDGNLMVSFMLTSGSTGGELKTTNIYKYYHSPGRMRRITVHVHHEVLKDSHVKGIENVDGRFGALISYHSKSSVTDKMCFGEILPFLHVYMDDERVREYKLEENPESRDRTWIISYEDDCDLGSRAWLSYDEGGSGKTHGIILSSNHNLISNATQERDGVEVKVAEREYLNIVGTEVDYISIAFGRNSYEPFSVHDVDIPRRLTIEFDAEFITIQNGSYHDVDKESIFFQSLVKSRSCYEETKGEQNIYTLTVIPHLTGRIGSFPVLRNSTNLSLPVLYGELYYNGSLFRVASPVKPFIGFQVLKFTGLPPGRYVVKIYREFNNKTKKFIGVGFITITGDTVLHIYCTWQQLVEVSVEDQHGNNLK
ncbi:MAG TPA: carboxypeptidase regulatory-like domain-containing protein, partial [Thermoplasmatales archaeon]|nr:carboxypeptidase regulatory-like domain-containing protein [Thermoplasmatales archaeon]